MNEAPRQRARLSGMVVLLALLALWDLRVEIQLLLQQFTFTALGQGVWSHPLAVTVLALLPSLQRRLGAAGR